MLKTATRVWVCAYALGAGCADNGRTKTEGEAVASCDCAVDWGVDNTALCVAPHTSYSPPVIFSSHLADNGKVACAETQRFPQPVSSQPWSTQHLSSRCTGTGTLTLRVRQGQAKSASPDDCILAEQTLDFDYAQANKSLLLPPVEAWSAQSETCSRAFEEAGGYFEFRITSSKLGCGAADEKVKYVDICLATCFDDPSRPGCEACVDPPSVNRL